MRHLLSRGIALFALVAACSPGSAGNSGGQAVAPPPGDHFFDSAATTTGSAASPETKIRVAIVLFDPSFAANHPPGTPGSNPNIREAAGRIVASPGAVDLTGTWGTDNSVTLEGAGWHLNGKVDGVTVTGSFQGPEGSGVFAGADIVVGAVAVDFGKQGDGAFDVVISKSGALTGVIGGAQGGFITGTATGDSMMCSWDANGTKGSGSGTVGYAFTRTRDVG